MCVCCCARVRVYDRGGNHGGLLHGVHMGIAVKGN